MALDNVTSEQFMSAYKKACSALGPHEENLIALVQEVTPRLVLERVVLKNEMQVSGVHSATSLKYSEETYLLAIFKTIAMLLEEVKVDPFFASLEKQMKEE